MKLFLAAISMLFVLFTSSVQAQTEKSDFFNTDSIQQISIEFNNSQWRESLDSLYTNGEEYTLAKVKINGQAFPFSGVRLSRILPNSTRSKKNSFDIKLNFINQAQNYEGSKNIILSQSLRDPSLVRDLLFSKMANDFMLAPRANYVSLDIDGSFYGVMINIEAIDEVFVKRKFYENEGTFLACSVDEVNAERIQSDDCLKKSFASLQLEKSPTCYFDDFQLLSPGGWDDLMRLSEVLEDKESTVKDLEEILDLDQALWYLALNNLTVSLDSYLGRESKNFYLYQDRNGKFHIIPWAANLSFGSLKSATPKSDLSIDEMIELDPLLHADNTTKPLVNALMKHKDLRQRYLAFYRALFDRYLSSKWYESEIEELQNRIRPIRINESANYYEMEDFESSTRKIIGKVSKIPPITEFLEKRRKHLKKEEFIKILPPEVTDIRFEKREAFSDEKIEDYTLYVSTDNYTKRVHLFYLFDGAIDMKFKQYALMDDGKGADEEAGDGIFSGSIPAGNSESMKFYIRAENVQLEKYFPQDYVFNKEQISLEQLNQ